MKIFVLARCVAVLVALSVLSACSSLDTSGSSGGVAPPRAGSIGLSAKGRALTASTLGSGPLRIYLIGGIHGDEPEGQPALVEIRRAFSSPPLVDLVTLRVVDDLNPDGTRAGSRTSSTGIDLNRNWPASNFRPARARGKKPLSEPETIAAHADILTFDPHMLVVLHSSGDGPYVNFDGPPAARALADRFASAAGSAGQSWRVVPDMGYPTPGSMGSYFGKDRGIPILTIELRRAGPSTPAISGLAAGMRSLATSGTLASRPLSRASPSTGPVAAPRRSGS